MITPSTMVLRGAMNSAWQFCFLHRTRRHISAVIPWDGFHKRECQENVFPLDEGREDSRHSAPFAGMVFGMCALTLQPSMYSSVPELASSGSAVSETTTSRMRDRCRHPGESDCPASGDTRRDL